MRRRLLVTYDIADAKRLRRVHRCLLGYGDPLQYSVFLCNLGRTERILLKQALGQLLDARQDRVMLLDVGPLERDAGASFEFLGQPPDLPEPDVVVVI